MSRFDTGVKIYRSDPRAPLPEQKSAEASGFDLAAILDEPLILEPHHTYVVPTGIHFDLPPGMEVQIRPRSSLSKAGVLVSFGTLDSDFKSYASVVLTKVTLGTYEVRPLDRIGQACFAHVIPVRLEEVDSLDKFRKTARGDKGWGSTGR